MKAMKPAVAQKLLCPFSFGGTKGPIMCCAEACLAWEGRHTMVHVTTGEKPYENSAYTTRDYTYRAIGEGVCLRLENGDE